ncbi:hypothetical protein FAIPA1_400015 [Frankia sp. AiPs1]
MCVWFGGDRVAMDPGAEPSSHRSKLVVPRTKPQVAVLTGPLTTPQNHDDAGTAVVLELRWCWNCGGAGTAVVLELRWCWDLL